MVNQNRNPLVREAVRWFAVVRDDAATEEDKQACEKWKSQSEEHAAAWKRAEALWLAFAPVESELKQSKRAKLSRRTLIGSGAALLVAGSGTWWLYQDGTFADYKTASGERRSFTLPDGSIMELDGRSSATLDYTNNRRRLILHEGEAYFTVASQANRPFIVKAANGTTRALGTQFNVHVGDERVTVTVAEHSVEVSLSGQHIERLESGWQVVYSRQTLSTPVKADIASVEAWRNGRLVYHGAPLQQVLNDIERHRGGYIFLMNRQLQDVAISAAFDAGSADEALDTIAQMLPLRVVRTGKIVFLYAN